MFFMVVTFIVGGLLSGGVIPSLISGGSIIFDSIFGVGLLSLEFFVGGCCLSFYKDNIKTDKELEKTKKELYYERDFQKEMLKEFENNKSRDLELLYQNKKSNKLLFISKMNEELKAIRKSIEARKIKEDIKEKEETDKGIALKKVNNNQKN